MSDPKQHPAVLWFTGLSAAGKTTLIQTVHQELQRLGYRSCVLDGDDLRSGLNQDLGFSSVDRSENVRRVAEVARLFVKVEFLVLVGLISPLREQREKARRLFEPGQFLEVYVDAPIEICASRDPKGLYQRARQGEINDFTGIQSPYEPPRNPELHLKTHEHSVAKLVDDCLQCLKLRDLIT